MPLFEHPHAGHENHLCELIRRGHTFSDYFNLIRDAKYICRECGRVAAKEENLCSPTPIPES